MPATAGSPSVVTSRGTVTFLFSDIEGSTRLLQTLGPAWPRVLEAHGRILEGAFEAEGGRVVDTAGDGYFAAFETARAALAAAAAAQRALAGHPWPPGAEVRVRMGIHTGESLVGPTGYVGLDVHRAARIASAAHGGQILLSEATRQLVAGELAGGITLRPLGEHRLKDLPRPEWLHQVVISELPSSFPPPRGVGGEARLPVAPTPLLGREEDLVRLIDLVRRTGVRLVTLTGPGGTGKTRLALEAAHRLREEFAGRAHFIALVGVRDPAGVIPAIARSLEVPEMAGTTTIESLAAWIGEKPSLLVLDNFEQVVNAAPAVASLLAAAPALRLLVTSRAPLNLTAEHEVAVPPLGAPAGNEPDTAVLRAYPAVELFLQRAASARPSIGRDPDDLAAVAEICRRLDGLPLAIELAAARIRLFPPRALLARLDRRLELLSSGPRDLPERHRTLREAIGWSHDLLDPGERVLFRRLALFPGGFSFEAAEAVAEAAPGSASAIEGLASLVERSLVRRLEEADDGRFGMLETIREYGLEKLAESGEMEMVATAAADYLIALVETAEPALTGPSPSRALERLDQENDNLRAAFDWLDEGQLDRALRLGAALWRYWVIRGRHTEGLERLRHLVRSAADRPVDAAMVRVLTGAATMSYEHGYLRDAREHLEFVLRHYRAAGDESGIATTLNHLGWTAIYDSDFETGLALSSEALEICERLRDRRGTALALNNLGWRACLLGETLEARSLLERSLAVRRAVGDPRGIAYAQLNLAWVHLRQDEVGEANTLAGEGLATLRALGDRQIIPYGLYLLGWALHRRGDSEEALERLREAARAAREIGHAINLGFALGRLGEVMFDLGDPEGALACHEDALETQRRSSLGWAACMVVRCIGEDLVQLGRLEEAGSRFAESLDTAVTLRMRVEIAECLEGIASLASALERPMDVPRALGAAETLRSLAHAPLPRVRAGRIDGCRARARELVAGPDFETAWAEGRAAAADVPALKTLVAIVP